MGGELRWQVASDGQVASIAMGGAPYPYLGPF